jgi:hypothetical protein
MVFPASFSHAHLPSPMIANTFLNFFGLGLCGALALEALKFVEYSGKLTESRFKKALGSLKFWCTIGALCVSAGFVSWAFFAGIAHVSAWQLVVTGAGARSLLRDAVAARIATKGPALGDGDADGSGDVSTKEIFL